MGLGVDKLITSFLDYTWKKVLLLPPDNALVRKKLQNSTGVQHPASSIILLQWKQAVCNESKTPENEEVKRVQVDKNKAVEERGKGQTKHTWENNSLAFEKSWLFLDHQIWKQYTPCSRYILWILSSWKVQWHQLQHQNHEPINQYLQQPHYTLLLKMRDPTLETVLKISSYKAKDAQNISGDFMLSE